MTKKSERYAAGRELVIFLGKYSEVIEKQLIGTRELIENAVSSVMNNIIGITRATGQEAQNAAKVLEETYFTPDQKTKELVDKVQLSVDQVFQNANGSPDPTSGTSKGDTLVDNRLRRFAGQFSKHMEALNTLDGELSQILIRMMGALSADDVIRQKLEHLLACIRALQLGLSYTLIDFSGRFNVQEIQEFKADLLAFTYAQYTSEEEKQCYRKIFGQPVEKRPSEKRRFTS